MRPAALMRGGQDKTNGVRAHLFLSLHPADFLQRPEPRPFPLGHDEHPVFDQNSVVRVERHDIGDGSERHQIEIFAHVGGRAGEQAVQGGHEQKSDAYPGQFPAGPFLQFGIDDDVRFGQFRAGEMMIRDHRAQPQSLGFPDFRHTRDAAVHGQ